MEKERIKKAHQLRANEKNSLVVIKNKNFIILRKELSGWESEPNEKLWRRQKDITSRFFFSLSLFRTHTRTLFHIHNHTLFSLSPLTLCAIFVWSDPLIWRGFPGKDKKALKADIAFSQRNVSHSLSPQK